jgi:hypothetical protein
MAFDLNSMLDISHLVTFVGGAILGSASQYLADRFTDQRRKQETNKSAKTQFLRLKEAMPDLFSEMAKDLSEDKTGTTREFVILPNDQVDFISSKLRFSYFESTHQHLHNQIDMLLESGYVEDITSGKVRILRMNDNFVQMLK